MSDNNFDAIIVGAGPVGLFLACELALSNISTLILERDLSPHSIWKDELGIRGLNILSSEALYRRDLLSPLISHTQRSKIIEETINQKMNAPAKFAGHFAGIVLDGEKVDYAVGRWKWYLPGPAMVTVGTKMIEVEGVLGERAEELGVRILRGREAIRISNEADFVKIWTQSGEVFTAPWVVGCDGGRSTIRHLSSVAFQGSGDDEAYGYKGVFTVDRPSLLPFGLHRTATGIYIHFTGGWYIVDFVAFDRSQPVTLAHLQAVLQRVTQTDVTITELSVASTFTLRSVQAETYRKGRVLLAGDSAHIHSPIGAQGLSLGIGDAVNLGWKLAATIKGTAASGLLDSYQKERRPVGEAVLKWASAQSLILQPGPMACAAYEVFADMIATTEGNTYFAERVSGLGHRYRIGGMGCHDLVGYSVPDFEFVDGQRLGEKMRDGSFLVIVFGKADENLVEEILSWVPAGVRYIGCAAKQTLGISALAVRPDGIVCWATEAKINLGDLRSVLATWLVI